jgi:hypothetical protein
MGETSVHGISLMVPTLETKPYTHTHTLLGGRYKLDQDTLVDFLDEDDEFLGLTTT